MKGNERQTKTAPTEKEIWDVLQKVNDPEVPVLSILDLGIVRDVKVGPPLSKPHPASPPSPEEKEKGNESVSGAGSGVRITITPTYSGCPAMDVISMDIRLKMMEHGYRNVAIQQQLSPAWTTDWMTEEGKAKLKAYGIAPPQYNRKPSAMFEETTVECPLCHSSHTELLSEFSSTACKAMYRCLDCREAFDHFKCH